MAVSNKEYDLISVLYHALQGAETTDKYIKDAEQSGDEELVTYFREVKDQYLKIADRGKSFLGKHVS
jgi:hypothetical protein